MYGTGWRNKRLSSVKTGHIILGIEHNHHSFITPLSFVHADVFYFGIKKARGTLTAILIAQNRRTRPIPFLVVNESVVKGGFIGPH